MTIKQHGGVFGRNPTFNDVTVEGDLVVDGTLTIGGNVITGLDYEGGWNASTNTPDLTTAAPAAGKFWIVSVAGSTDLGGITNWSQGDWALYDGSAWQRVEGGTVDLTNGVTGILPIANGGTNASDAATARTNLGSGAVGDNLFTATTALAAQQAMDTEVGVDVQAYDATILKSADIGSAVQAYDAGLQSISGLTTAADKMIYTTASDTYAVTDLTSAGRALLDDADAAAQRTTLGLGTAATTASTDYATAAQGSTADSAMQDLVDDTTPQLGGNLDLNGKAFEGTAVFNESGADVDFRIESDTNTHALFVDAGNSRVGINRSSPQAELHVNNNWILGGRASLQNYNNDWTVSTSATEIMELNGLGHFGAELTVIFADGTYQNGSFVQKLYVATRGSGTNVTNVTLTQEDKVRSSVSGFTGYFTWTAAVVSNRVRLSAAATATSGSGTISILAINTGITWLI